MSFHKKKKKHSAMVVLLCVVSKALLASVMFGFSVYAFSHLNNLAICHVPHLYVVSVPYNTKFLSSQEYVLVSCNF